VYVEGRLRTREYEGNDGTKRKVVEIIASQMIMLGGGRDKPKQETSVPAVGGFGEGGIENQDIPF
jgi:single-stranded DNA-binding protein